MRNKFRGVWRSACRWGLLLAALVPELAGGRPSSAAVLPTSLCTCRICAAPLEGGGPAAAAFAFFNTATAWNPGPNAARIGGHPSPGSATFSIMGPGFGDVSGFDPDHGAHLTVDITSLGIPGYTAADYAQVVDWALNTWAAGSGFTNLGQVPDGGAAAGASEASGGHLGDIRVAAWEIVNPAQIAHTFQPGNEAVFGPGGSIAGDLHLDPSRVWSDDPTDTTLDPDYDIYTVVLHEIGHALGLQHSGVPGAVMNASYFGARRTLSADDLAGIQALYGVPEPASILLAAMSTLALAGWGLARRRGSQAPAV